MSPPRTIVGVATGSADGGVAIVRLSGPSALSIARDHTGELPPPRTLGRRRLRVGDGDAVEDALVVQMPGPRSFTGEDVVELHVHGGERNVEQIVAKLLASGATAAGPGDFSRRAFMNGRLTLDQAEGIAALIAAQTQAAVEQARRLIAGELGSGVDDLRVRVGELRTEVEAHLDFSEDVGEGDEQRWAGSVAEFIATLEGWLSRFESGRRARSRLRVILAGPPNAGKSSLFNALLGHPRAIVDATPGTTRDYVEAELNLRGRSVTLVDTAGLRGDAGDAIEHAGIDRSRQQIRGADLILWIEPADAEKRSLTEKSSTEKSSMEDSSTERSSTEKSSMEEFAPDAWRIESKRDLGCLRPAWFGVSTATGLGLDPLVGRLEEWARGGDQEPWIGLARHRDRAEEAMQALEEAKVLLDQGRPIEVVAFHLAVAERRLAEVTGRSALGAMGQDVLARIFSRFCIGK